MIRFGVLLTSKTNHPRLVVGERKEVRGLVVVVAAFLAAAVAHAATNTPTFNEDIAPVLFANCIACHHENGMGPFPLTTYPEVRKHARQIAELTQSRTMPPWPPAPGYGDFLNPRHLDDAQIALIQQWVRDGAPEGDPAKVPSAPKPFAEWKLGKPDLILTFPEPYNLPADGKDLYRNIVVPTPITARRYVKAVELRPSNGKVIHHAFLLLDTTGDARQRDARDPGPGFEGMRAGDGTGSPDGFEIGWQPGRVPQPPQDDLAWPLDPGTDIVIQMHLRPSGKPEPVNMTIALYFADTPPTKHPVTIGLRSSAIDIPPSSTNTSVTSTYKLPVAVRVLSVLPHAHYLGHDIRGWATLPDGTQKALLWIRNWDFNWQGAYRYRTPINLPAGSVIAMRVTYDNSTNNPVNPNTPPKRVRFGLQSTDEMAELGLQLLPENPADLGTLRSDYTAKWGLPDAIALYTELLSQNPADSTARTDRASIYARIGRYDEALAELRTILTTDPRSPRANRLLAQIYARGNDIPKAIAAYETALRDDPDDPVAHADLGWLLVQSGKKDEGIAHLQTAHRINPNDPQIEATLRAARAP